MWQVKLPEQPLIISNAGKKLLTSTWRLDFNSCAVEEILEGAGFQSAFWKMSPSMGVSLPFQGITRAQKFNHARKNLVCILIHTACFGKCDFIPPPSAPLLLAVALMEVLCPTLSILEKVLGPAQIALLSQMLETRSWLGDPEGPFCYDSRINQSQLMK